MLKNSRRNRKRNLKDLRQISRRKIQGETDITVEVISDRLNITEEKLMNLKT